MAMPPPPPPPPPFGSNPNAGYFAGSNNKPDRKTVERNRRNQMNALYSRLDTLVRDGSTTPAAAGGSPATTRPDRLEAAAAYIRQTAERVERLKERKRELVTARTSVPQQGSSSYWAVAADQVEVQHLGSGLHAILVTVGAPPSDGGASFHHAVRAVEEAGGAVQNAHFSVVGARAIYTIHTLVTGQQGGIERVVQRLKAALRGDA